LTPAGPKLNDRSVAAEPIRGYGGPVAMQQSAQPDVRVPFLDLSPANAPIREQLLADIGDLLETGAFTNGPAVARFEAAFAEYCGVEHCVGVSSGLDALRLGLLAGGLEPGAEVVVPAATFVATLEAVTQAGGIPVVVDVSESDYCVDPAAAAAAIGPKTHSLMPVHLYGQMADMQALSRLADEKGVTILEDACQAHGAERDGVRAGAGGAAAAFSFYPGKNLGAAGDAGALVTRDGDMAGVVRALREHGQTAKYRHTYEGWTARLDTIQALVLSHKLPLLDDWNEQRRLAARFYDEALRDVGDLVLPPVPTGSTHVWHLYVVRTGDPEAPAAFLREHGIGTGRHYPDPVHLTDAYVHLGYRPGEFPVAEALARECLSLPMFPGITEGQLAAVADAVSAFFDG
jgi:dTDP-4-amino-4,6-dideoxygalactose transaminase